MLYHKLGEPGGQSKVDEPRVAVLSTRSTVGNAVHVALDEMSAQPVADSQGALEIHALAQLSSRRWSCGRAS